ncbi:hypothetical protein E4U44_003254 [Claviceps purpurea]|nr:hypothetical protein E4U44_003254 [Claviceps purpurea]
MSGAGAAPIRLFLLVMAEVEFRHQNLILVTVTPATMEKTSTVMKRIPTLKPVVQAFQREPWQQWYTIHPSRMRQSGQVGLIGDLGLTNGDSGVSPHVTPRHNDITKLASATFASAST